MYVFYIVHILMVKYIIKFPKNKYNICSFEV